MKLDFSKRKLRKRQRQVEALGATAESLAEQHFFKRLDRLVPVRRFVVAWLLFFVLICGVLVGQIRALDGHFRSLKPVPGGMYTEGILGDFTTANPLYASSEVDESVSKLIFAGLLKYDNQNHLVGDLASYWSVDASEKVYTVHLKPNLTWQDGSRLTAQDVLFTYRTIQNPDARSVLNPSWRDITVAAPDPSTVTFTLPNPLSAFPYQLTNGIIPEHLLKNVDPAEMRSATFNTEDPIGAGPFMWDKIEVSGATPETRQEKLALAPFDNYEGGKPKLASFVVDAFHDPGRLEDAFHNKEVNGASFLQVPPEAAKDKNIQVYNMLLTAANMVFFNETDSVLGDANVRKALVLGADVPKIMDRLGYASRPVKGPLLEGQLGYDPTITQAAYDPVAAAAALDKAGWVKGVDGMRSKDGKPLTFTVDAQNTPENSMVTSELRKDWRQIGVRVDIRLKGSDELQQTISNQSYQALLYGVSIGVDPDVFVYWDSSQTDPRSNRLNFSFFKSKTADTALEGARTRADPALRAAKYKPFLQAWQDNTPALGLYQPRYLYVTHGKVAGLDPHFINSDIGRYNNVQNWEIREASVTD